ncbi:CPBP family intramembrane glutamic endopeptidase [Flaviaesturariibacter amylovorans]|uniref:Type II CAAX endopeptidase family protein n=1 Tax=Flaviaesturariibacter amylovorans TaxID=1084520 RepID=A0ABP8H5N5_9BACT
MLLKQLLVFFLAAYLFSWIIWLPLYGPVIGINTTTPLPLQHALGGLGPLLASFLCIGIFEGKGGMLRLLHACWRPTPLLLLAIALLSPFILALLASLLSFTLYATSIDLSSLVRSTEFPHFGLLSVFLYNLLFFGWGEEAGWRGFALPRLQARLKPLSASLVLTILWAAWHLPLFTYRPGYMEMGLSGAVGWLLSLLTGSVLLSWLFNASKGSVLICAVFHATIDIAFTAKTPDNRNAMYMGILITIWGFLTMLLWKPKNIVVTGSHTTSPTLSQNPQ